ncbi:MAG TPA: FecR domain-containing protein [Verrucomicrobiae bacterium]
MKTTLLIGALVCLTAQCGQTAPLTESTFTEVIHVVNRLDDQGQPSPAKMNDLLKAPERVRTGPESRAELTAADHTITRVGANTVFSFADSGRTLNLEQGSLLFHAPKGQGGGTIKSGGASAAVLGTTLIVSATPTGGFKVVLLEGQGKLTLANGKTVTLQAGQMVFVASNGTQFSDVLTINLGKLVAGSNLVNGFAQPLASRDLIAAAVAGQNQLLAKGSATDTGRAPVNGLAAVDHGGYETSAHPVMNKLQYTQVSNAAIGGGAGGRNFSSLDFFP